MLEKQAGRTGKVLACLRMVDKVNVISFHRASVRRVKQLEPASTTSILLVGGCWIP